MSLFDREEIHQDDVGTVFRAVFVDGGQIVDVSFATARTIRWTKPDGSSVEVAASFTTDGTDGAIEAASPAGLLDQIGELRWQGIVGDVGNVKHSQIATERILSNLPAP